MELGLSCYLSSFLEAGYDNLIACQDMTDQDLDNIGGITKPGHRKTLLTASKELNQRRKNGILWLSQSVDNLFLQQNHCLRR